MEQNRSASRQTKWAGMPEQPPPKRRMGSSWQRWDSGLFSHCLGKFLLRNKMESSNSRDAGQGGGKLWQHPVLCKSQRENRGGLGEVSQNMRVKRRANSFWQSWCLERQRLLLASQEQPDSLPKEQGFHCPEDKPQSDKGTPPGGGSRAQGKRSVPPTPLHRTAPETRPKVHGDGKGLGRKERDGRHGLALIRHSGIEAEPLSTLSRAATVAGAL